MTANEFRAVALSVPEALESSHMAHPDFRVGGKIFATLGYPDDEHGVLLLPPEEQARLVREHPAAFAPVKGAWGKRGSTQVHLATVDRATLEAAMWLAWRKRAPKRLARDID